MLQLNFPYEFPINVDGDTEGTGTGRSISTGINSNDHVLLKIQAVLAVTSAQLPFEPFLQKEEMKKKLSFNQHSSSHIELRRGKSYG